MTTELRIQPLAASTAMLAAEHARLSAELMEMEQKMAVTRAGPASATLDEQMAERDAIDQQMKTLAHQTPERAKKLVEEADRLMLKRDDEFAALRARRNAIDETFKVSAQQAAETEKRARTAARQAAVDDILALNETILISSETAEAHLHAAIAAIRDAMEAAQKANGLTKKLSGGAWSGFDAVGLTNFFSAEFSRTFREAWGKPTFGLHCTFRMPTESIRGGRYLETWRARAEKETAAAVEAVKGEL